MKYKVLAVFLFAVAACLGSPEFGVTVSTSSVKVAPERGVVDVADWTSGSAVAQGQLVRYQKTFYMAESAVAVSTNPPPNAGYTVFRRLENDHARQSLVLCNVSTNNIWLNIGGPARLNAGIRLSSGWSIAIDDIQTPVFAISSASSLLTGVDVSK